MKKELILSLVFMVLANNPVYACLSCGCESSGASTNIGTLGGASGIFSKGKRFLVQLGSSFRSLNGSFNETGRWNPAPVDSQIYTLQPTLGIMYFPSSNLSFGLQIPYVSNFLSKATWGSFGSIAPTDINHLTSGGAVGDINGQITYKFYDNNEMDFASAVWGQLDAPTGMVSGKPEELSGGGIYRAVAGILGVKKIGKFELLGNIGYQQPLSKAQSNSSSFSIGNAFLYQLQSDYQVADGLKFGLGFNGYIGSWSFTTNNTSMITSKIKLMATGQYDFSFYNGIGLDVGYDPGFFGSNATTDTSMNVVFYQFF